MLARPAAAGHDPPGCCVAGSSCFRPHRRVVDSRARRPPRWGGGSAPPALEGRPGAIRIVGNHAIASDALEPALALHEAIGDGAAADPYLLTLDTDRIRAAYVKRGFFAATVAPSVEPPASGAQVVVFTVVEGRRAATRVVITGLPSELAPGTARALVELGDGAPFDYDRYDAAKAPLVAPLRNGGHPRAEG